MANETTVQWAVELAPDDAEGLAPLRLHPGLYVLTVRDAVWLSGSQTSDLQEAWFAQLSCRARYVCDQDSRLTPVGGRVPTMRLPDGEWCPISLFLSPQIPSPALAAQLVRKCRIALREATTAREAGAILTDPTALGAWAETASDVRLRRLRFALCEDGRLLLVGTPLPPIRGNSYVSHRQLLLPAGQELDPPALRDLLPGMMSLAEGDVVLFHRDGSGERIGAHDFVPASRSAIRRTLEAIQ